MLRRILMGVALVSFAATGCTMHVRPAPPPPRVEVHHKNHGHHKGHHKHEVWVPGHWKWKNRRQEYVWVPGHWQRRR